MKQLQQGGASEEDIVAARARYLNTLHQYQGFSKRDGDSGGRCNAFIWMDLGGLHREVLRITSAGLQIRESLKVLII